ncbi:hypothetical protein TWF718_000544 [Orbilia javanica]|uniref:Uncharacterized protein n=1 Tax=Orbilia javanica TaxID=47235 RepID=A0AAN8RM21_9PEZI
MHFLQWATLLFLLNTWNLVVSSETTTQKKISVHITTTTLVRRPVNIRSDLSSLSKARGSQIPDLNATLSGSGDTEPSEDAPTKTIPEVPVLVSYPGITDAPLPYDPDSELDPERRANIPPHIFYKRGPYVKCPPLSHILTNIQPEYVQEYNIRPTDFPQNFWRSEANIPNMPSIRRQIRHRLALCRTCACTRWGKVIAPPGLHTRSGNRLRSCRNARFAAECVVFYGCMCELELHDDLPGPAPTGATIQDFQTALDSIPNWFKSLNLFYSIDIGTYLGGNSHYITWNPNYFHRGTRADTHRELAPDTKEPYWLEGPDPRQGNPSESWLRFGYDSTFGGSMAMVKREEGTYAKNDTIAT